MQTKDAVKTPPPISPLTAKAINREITSTYSIIYKPNRQMFVIPLNDRRFQSKFLHFRRRDPGGNGDDQHVGPMGSVNRINVVDRPQHLPSQNDPFMVFGIVVDQSDNLVRGLPLVLMAEIQKETARPHDVDSLYPDKQQ